MKYINITQAAGKWNLTVRRVQDLCKSGAILGATRFGRAWMIPEDAPKPMDGRTREAKAMPTVKNGEFMIPAPRLNPLLFQSDLYSTPGTADQVVASFGDYPGTQRFLQDQLDYMRGNLERVYHDNQFFLKAYPGFNTTVSAGIMLSRCAMYRGDLQLWQKARRHICDIRCQTEEERQTIAFWLAVMDSALHDTDEFPEWFKKGKFDYLPADSYCVARVFYVKYMFIAAHDLASGKISFENVKGLGLMRSLPYIIEPMISQAKIEGTLIPEIYLHLMVATVYHNLGEDRDAVEHIDAAIAISLPDGIVSPLVEYRSGMDSLLDDRLALADETMLKKVKELHKQMSAGWIRLHNLLTERNVSTALTIREREVAKLAAYGYSNTEIATRLHIEVSSVKRYIFSAMNKVGAEKRTELGQFI